MLVLSSCQWSYTVDTPVSVILRPCLDMYGFAKIRKVFPLHFGKKKKKKAFFICQCENNPLKN